MVHLTFGEQVKIILSRKSMTIKELAEIIEERTGKKMSRQNLTQRLGRDNFQEQDMRMIADILECPFKLTIMESEEEQEMPAPNERIEADSKQSVTVKAAPQQKQAQQKQAQQKQIQQKQIQQGKQEEAQQGQSQQEQARQGQSQQGQARQGQSQQGQARQGQSQQGQSQADTVERDITIGELVEIHEELDALIEQEQGELAPGAPEVEELLKEVEELEAEAWQAKRDHDSEVESSRKKPSKWMSYLQGRMSKGEESDAGEVGQTFVQGDAPRADQTLNIQEDAPHADQPSNIQGDAPYTDQTSNANVQGESAEQEEAADDLASGKDLTSEKGSAEEIYEAATSRDEEDRENGDVNPYSGREYETNSVRMHPSRIGYVQVYDREDHAWTDMTEWAFLGYQERKKALLGKDYEPPIYLD